MNKSSIPKDLIEHFKKKDVVLFIGAGVSANAGMLNWIDLIKPLAEAVEFRWPLSGSDITTDHLLSASRYYENRFGRNSLIRYLKEKLDTTHLSPSMVHLLLSVLPVKVVFTTNYDDLVERTYREASKPFHVIVSEPELAYWSEDQVQIVKLCGELNRPESIAITKFDFNIFNETHRRLIEKLRSTLETKTAVFLGYGLRDPFVNQIWDNISFVFGEHRRNGYIVLFDPNSNETEDLKRRGIYVISLGEEGKDKSEAFLNWLESLVAGIATFISKEDIQRLNNGNVNSEILARLTRIEQKIDEGFNSNVEFANQVLEALHNSQVEQKNAVQMVDEIKAWIKDLQENGIPLDPKLQSSLDELSQHYGSTYQYLQLAIPVIPGIASYNVEIGSQHLINLKNLWKQFQERFSHS
jgi:hypothetical protein